MSIKIISLNVNGIREKSKRQTLFYWLKKQNADIYLLQETHCENNDDISKWMKEWDGNAYWSLGTNFSKGVATLFKPKLEIETENIKVDTQGRFIDITISLDELKANIFNVYAPNQPTERKQFFKNLNDMVKSATEREPETEIIIGGDFNCVMDINTDRRYKSGISKICEDCGNKELKDLMLENNLEDPWQRRYPNKKQYTYFKTNSRSASRIDFWLINKSLDPMIMKTSINQAVRSDHASIKLEIKTTLQDRGPGYWKRNNKVLQSDYFDRIFVSFWNNWKDTIHDTIHDYQTKKNGGKSPKAKLKKSVYRYQNS